MLYLNDDFDGGELFFTDRDAKTVTVSHLTFKTQVEHFTLADLHMNFDLCPTVTRSSLSGHARKDGSTAF